MKKKVAVVFVLVALLLGGLAILMPNIEIDRAITPEEQTYTAIGETAYRIDMYMSIHLTVPRTLSELPKRDGYSNSTTDGWSNELVYAISSEGTLSLSSLGKDRKPGGAGDDADISATYPIKSDMSGLILEK